MATDKTWFDDKLKSNLFLDVGFRSIIWLGISLLAPRHATNTADFSPVVAFKRTMESLLPVVLDVTRLSFVFCIAAMILKDLEHVSPTKWGQDTRIGRLGGLVRRLAGDLSTWIIGVLISFLASFLMFVSYIQAAGNWSDDAKSVVAVLTTFFIISIPVFSVANVWIRKDTSLVSSHQRYVEVFNTPAKVVLFYLTLAAFVILSANYN